MKQYPQPILALFVAAMLSMCAAWPGVAAGDIVVAAQETTATVTPRPTLLKLVNLPGLEFGLRAVFKCRGDPVSVTFSVADTHRTLGKQQLMDRRAAETTLRVSPEQLALAATDDFCIVDAPETADELLVPGLATAHASLRCSGEDGDSVHYASAPLQVRLICARDSGADQPSSDVPE